MIEVQNLKKTYRLNSHEVKALRGVSFKIEKPNVTAIMGPSGSGKSTLLHLIGGLDKFEEGEIRVGEDQLSMYSEDDLAHYRNSTIGFVFQTFFMVPHYTVLENVSMSLLLRSQESEKHITRKAKEILNEVGIGELEGRYPNQLSGGQLQRVVIARALVNDPMIILADEPTGNLDQESGQKIIDLLCELQKKRNAHVIIITHDPEISKRTDQVIKILDGTLNED